MMKILLNLRIVFILSLFISCPWDGHYEGIRAPLPSFEGIEVNEDTIFLINSQKYPKYSELYAVDTKKEIVLYRYRFDNILLYDLTFNYAVDDSVYFVLLDGRFIALKTSTGEVKEILIDYSPYLLSFVEEKVWIFPNTPGFEGVPVNYNVYDPKSSKIETVQLPEGLFLGESMVRNQDRYFALQYSSTPARLYNDSKKRFISNSGDLKKYQSIRFTVYFIGDEYLAAVNSGFCDVFKINDIENGEYEYLFQTEVTAGIYEDEDYFYFIDREVARKIDKTDFKVIESELPGDSMNIFSYCKNGSLWIVSDDHNGTYKISMEDFSVQVIQ